MRRFKKNTIEESTINLTPLIDVIFVILVMFMIVAPLLNLETIDLAVHSAPSQRGATIDTDSIKIYVYQDNSLVINKRNTAWNEVSAVLKNLQALYPNATPLIIHDKRAQFGCYQSLKKSLEQAGFTQMHLILKSS